ncbi:uncharacterized protein PV09_09509 [Verruconis gallopava]|uniref:Uncharacterized protein n=1 Tax=Verruconis gallopava TaxID=253628 RepID=A0A0D1ZW61_9PEZI|nr:uncharacterized protein PV09_09509 [Verruconis gallopava]KIV98727.1 hypothetical protein PV09_09509 [Verruconis gallopava]
MAVLERNEQLEGTYFDEPPAYDLNNVSVTDRKELLAEVRSTSSSGTDCITLATPHFTPSKTLLVNARGIRLISLPLPSRELEIPITTTDGQLVYTSRRARICSGNAVLHDANDQELLASEYLFGPGRDPKIHILGGPADKQATIVTKSKWTSRQQEFVLPDGLTFTWLYKRERDAYDSAVKGKEKKRTHLILVVREAPPVSDESAGKAGDKEEEEGGGKQQQQQKKEKSGKEFGRRVAELVRNDEARTPGSSSTRAGNGGELKIDSEYCDGIGLREDVIVASCLMMLKKEIDRRRAVQFAMMAGASSGGS